MNPRTSFYMLVAAGLTGLTGCGAENPDAGEQASGSIELSLTNAPNDVACLKVTIDASRDTTKFYDLEPGDSTRRFFIDRLPVGRAVVDGMAYPAACDALDAHDDPSFVSEASDKQDACRDQSTKQRADRAACAASAPPKMDTRC